MQPPPPTDTAVPTTAPEPTAVPETLAELIELEQALQAIVDAQVDGGAPGAILMVDAPDLGLYWTGAAGMANVEAETPLTPDTPFRVIGITDMLTSVMVLRMVEEGVLGLDDPIAAYLDTAVIEQLNGPHGEPYGEAITVRHLLGATSGVAGFFLRGDLDLNGNNQMDFSEVILDQPEKVWSREDVIEYAIANTAVHAAPGDGFHGSDLEGVLLSAVVESAAGTSLADAYEIWLFKPLGMTDSFLVEQGDARLVDVAHVHYVGAKDVSDYASLSWLDGDVVSTAVDLDRFMRAWVDDALFTDLASMAAMTDWLDMSDAGYDGISIGLGVLDFDFAEFGAPEIGELMGQTSLWNGFVFYWPQYNIVLVGTRNLMTPLGSYMDMLAFPTMQAILPYVSEG